MCWILVRALRFKVKCYCWDMGFTACMANMSEHSGILNSKTRVVVSRTLLERLLMPSPSMRICHSFKFYQNHIFLEIFVKFRYLDWKFRFFCFVYNRDFHIKVLFGRNIYFFFSLHSNFCRQPF